MTRQDAAKAMIKDDLIGISEAINICSEETRAHFMLGGLLYIATVINGAIEWCEKANINVQSFIDTELIAKLRTNPQYFSRVFRKITGMTPTEFKNLAHI